MEYHVEVRTQDPVRVARSRFVTSMAEVCQDMGRGYRELWQSLERGKVQVTGDYALAVYPDPAFDPHRFTVEVAFEVGADATAGEGFEVAELPGGLFAVLLHVGPYESLGGAYEALMGWVPAQGYRFAGPMRDKYLNDPDRVPPEELRTEIQVPVERA